MSFLRRANTPTARETFLVAALAAVGISADDINAAQTANQPDFLKVLADESADLQAAQTAATEANTKLSSLTATITGAGFKAEDLTSPDTFKAAVAERVKSKVAADLVELSASRGISPVVQTPNDVTPKSTAKGRARMSESFKVSNN